MIESTNMAQSQSAPSLLGTWRLLSFEARDSKAQLQYPLGEHVSGLLVYDAGGNMAAHVMKNDRLIFAANDPDRGTDAEVRTAFEGHASYFGTYTIAWYPNWIGSDQVRHFKFEGSRLLLFTPPLISGGESLEYVLTWERIS
jgi:Lipocalin-like domain